MQDYLRANQGTVDSMGRTLADAGSQQAQTAENGADQWAAGQRGGGAPAGAQDPGSAAPTAEKVAHDQNQASQTLNSWNSYGGLYNDAQQQWGKSGPYSAGDNQFDALLLGTSGPQQRFKDVQGKYGGLDNYLQTRNATPAAPAPAGGGDLGGGHAPAPPGDKSHPATVNYAPEARSFDVDPRWRKSQPGSGGRSGQSAFNSDWRV